MHYTIRHETRCLEPYYLGPGKSNPRSTRESRDESTYRTTDPETFRSILDEILDVPEYDLTDANIEKEFSSWSETPLKPEKTREILAYYRGRKDARDAMIRDTERFSKNPDHVSFYRRYAIPEGSLSFSMNQHDEYAPFQQSETLELTVETAHD